MKPVLVNEVMIEQASNIFGALGDASRLKILRCLMEANHSMSQGAISEATGLSQANSSKHLACLVRAGLVIRTPEGNSVYFSPVTPLVDDLCRMVCGHVSSRAKASRKGLEG